MADSRLLMSVYCRLVGSSASTRTTIGLVTSSNNSHLNVMPVSVEQKSFCVWGFTNTSMLLIPNCCLNVVTLMEDRLLAMWIRVEKLIEECEEHLTYVHENITLVILNANWSTQLVKCSLFGTTINQVWWDVVIQIHMNLTGGQPLIKTKRGWGFRVYHQVNMSVIFKKIKIPKTPKIIFTNYFV